MFIKRFIRNIVSLMKSKKQTKGYSFDNVRSGDSKYDNKCEEFEEEVNEVKKRIGKRDEDPRRDF